MNLIFTGYCNLKSTKLEIYLFVRGVKNLTHQDKFQRDEICTDVNQTIKSVMDKVCWGIQRIN